jgi:tetraacyldisaccharide 4'-kinase
LARRGLEAGVALRGYKGAHGGARRLTDADSASDAGDEAMMIRRRLAVPVAVAPRRADAVRLLEGDCDVIVCDDGLQHYALERDVEIVVVDGMRGFGNGLRLPAGPLREPVSRLEEADAVIINGAGFDLPGAIRMRLQPVAVVAFRDGSRHALSEYSGREVVAAAAIGNPERYFAMLRNHGLVIETRTLPDHARFTPALAGAGRGKPVLLTEKDAVKYLDRFELSLPVVVLKSELKIVSGATHLFEEPGALSQVSEIAGEWFSSHLHRKAIAA